MLHTAGEIRDVSLGILYRTTHVILGLSHVFTRLKELICGKSFEWSTARHAVVIKGKRISLDRLTRALFGNKEVSSTECGHGMATRSSKEGSKPKTKLIELVETYL
jgi:hypothetical protein